jgi:hypothetical protein
VTTIQTESARPLRADARRSRERILDAAREVVADLLRHNAEVCVRDAAIQRVLSGTQ